MKAPYVGQIVLLWNDSVLDPEPIPSIVCKVKKTDRLSSESPYDKVDIFTFSSSYGCAEGNYSVPYIPNGFRPLDGVRFCTPVTDGSESSVDRVHNLTFSADTCITVAG